MTVLLSVSIEVYDSKEGLPVPYVILSILFLLFFSAFCYTFGDDCVSTLRNICFFCVCTIVVLAVIQLSYYWKFSPLVAMLSTMGILLALYFLAYFLNSRIPMETTVKRNGYFLFENDLLQGEDKKWCCASYRNPTKYRDGIVYVYASKWSFRRIVIARYRYDDIYRLRVVVEDAKTRKQIGAVIPSFYQFIYLSRKNEAFLRQQADKRFSNKECPEPSKIVAAFSDESLKGKIVDAETDRVLGYYDRGGIGAAAAFIALTSTFHTNTAYANYQVDWEFED